MEVWDSVKDPALHSQCHFMYSKEGITGRKRLNVNVLLYYSISFERKWAVHPRRMLAKSQRSNS